MNCFKSSSFCVKFFGVTLQRKFTKLQFFFKDFKPPSPPDRACYPCTRSHPVLTYRASLRCRHIICNAAALVIPAIRLPTSRPHPKPLAFGARRKATLRLFAVAKRRKFDCAPSPRRRLSCAARVLARGRRRARRVKRRKSRFC